MRGARRRITKRLADLPKACAIEPAIPDTATDSPTICTKFASAHMVMSALVMKHEQTHRSGLARNKRRIYDQKLGVGY
jgi:hypothetical protein